MFYKFRQNNSDGIFDVDDESGIGPMVWIEATDPVCAVSAALGLGIYFDGVAKGRDCGCCGDRWHKSWDGGETEPQIDAEWDFVWHDTVYVHRLTGDVERVKKSDPRVKRETDH